MNSVKILINSFFDAPKIIRKNRLGWGYFLGTVIGAIILFAIWTLSKSIEGVIVGKLNSIFNIENHITIVRVVLDFIIRVILIGIFYFIFKTVLMIILAPFLSYISEKVDTALTGREYKFTFKENIGFVIRGIKVALKCFIKELIFTVVVVCLGFIPVINIAVPALLFIVQSYFVSVNFIDYTLERKKMGVEETIEFMSKNKLVLCLGGGIFTILYFIPIVGIIFAPMLTIVAMTKTTIEILEKN